MVDQRQNVAQPLIGGLIVGKIVEAVAGNAINAALHKFAKSTNTSLTQEDVGAATVVVQQAINKETDARTQYSTNTEPWYQSRTILGGTFAVMGALSALYQLYTNGVPDGWDAYSAPTMVILGAGFAVFGRIFSKKPLGR